MLHNIFLFVTQRFKRLTHYQHFIAFGSHTILKLYWEIFGYSKKEMLLLEIKKIELLVQSDYLSHCFVDTTCY